MDKTGCQSRVVVLRDHRGRSHTESTSDVSKMEIVVCAHPFAHRFSAPLIPQTAGMLRRCQDPGCCTKRIHGYFAL